MRPLRSLALLSLVAAAPLAAQSAYFGQNQVQFRQFEWQVLRTEHFDIHYYPELAEVAKYTGMMAERTYARLRPVMGHEFRERKPILIFGSRGEYAQNNVHGDLGEGNLGATDPLRQRNMFFWAGDLGQAEHVLAHEMVHVFQFDIFARGRAGAGMQQLAQANPPLWFAEGMAQYLSEHRDQPYTNAMMRDAALNGSIPTIEQMEQSPNQFFPYTYGFSLWQYIGKRWGDEIVGEIMQATPSLGVDRAFRRYTGLDLEDLGEEWKEDLQQRFLPQVAELERPRKIAAPVLNARRTGGIVPIYVAPVLSPDGRQIAYISTGSLLRAEVFLDLYLADATTGKRIRRLTKSTLDPEMEELRYAYSQGSFSPDGRLFAFTAQRKGKDVLYIYDVRRERVVRRLDTPLQAMIGPSWSPDGRKLAFSGASGGLSDLYVIDSDGKNLTRLTNDPQGDHQPQWSPDGRYIAFASERGGTTDMSTLRFSKWRINLFDFETGTVSEIPGQDAKNLNPQWAPDGQSVAFISDRTGIPQLFLYDLASKEHYQLTKFVGGILSVTEFSPAMTWARDADKLAFTYHDNGDFTIWSVVDPRQLKKQPYRPPVVVAEAPGAPGAATPATTDSTQRLRAQAAENITAIARSLSDSINAAQLANDPQRRRSVYRATDGLRAASTLSRGEAAGVSIAALLDSANLALPDPSSFRSERYRGNLRPEYVARPQVGYAQDNFGQGLYGGTMIVLADLLGNHRLALAGAINGRLSEAQFFAMYLNSGGRLQWAAGVQQQPYFFLSDESFSGGGGQYLWRQTISRYIERRGNWVGLYPQNRFTRFETGLQLTNVDRSLMYVSNGINLNIGYQSGFYLDSIVNYPSLNYASPFVAWVQDNALMGNTGGIYGHRYRLQVDQVIGNVNWTNVLADLRRYDAILFNFLTLATRFGANMSIGPDETAFQKFIGNPYFVRGYDRDLYSGDCSVNASTPEGCGALQLLGSRAAYANVEVRFPLIRRVDFGVLPVRLPPVDGLFFYDFGLAWTDGQSLHLTKPDNFDYNNQRFPLRSYGFGIRLNLFGVALMRWDYAVPRDSNLRKGYWYWTIGQSF
jgi:Tol biopolymer transport system component